MADKQFSSLQDQIRSRQEGAFVGRTEPLRLFEDNLALPIDDPRRRFVITLSGAAGIGKTYLTRQWERLARGRGCATGYVDEAALNIPSAIELLVRGLAGCGAACPTVTAKLALYQKHRSAVDSDPGAPSGISSLLTRSAVRIGLRATEDIPLVGAFTGEIDKDAAAAQADQARAFLARRFTRHQDVELLLSPVDVLTAAFVSDLRTIGQERQIAVFVDTFERTGQYLDGWLLELLGGRHGELPADIVFAISGQYPVDANAWADYLAIRTDLELEVFTPSEARQLLATFGVEDAPAVNLILELSGGLPVLLATLAMSRDARGGAVVGDPTETAVDRFLKWVPDRERQVVAKSGALPRRLNREVLAVAGGTGEHFDWLRRLPFVVVHTDGYRYHEVVRSPILRTIRRESPAEWTTRHRALASYYASRRDGLGRSERDQWKDDRWRDLKLEEEYHKLCADGPLALPGALRGLVNGYSRSTDGAAQWIQMIVQAGRDAGLDEVLRRGEQLSAWLRTGEAQDELRLLSSLVADPALDDVHRGYAFAERGQVHDRLGDQAAAIADLERADELCPDCYWIIGWRGDLYQATGQFEQGLRDLDRAIELYPEYGWAMLVRSSIHLARRQYEDALGDLGRAIELDPQDPWNYAARATVYRYLDRFPAALADLDQAIELDPGPDQWQMERTEVFRAAGRQAEALAELDDVIARDPASTWAYACRGAVHRDFCDFDRAQADLDRAIELARTHTWPLACRAEIHRLHGRYGQALDDLNRCLELDVRYIWAAIQRAVVYERLDRTTEARADHDRAVALFPHDPYVIDLRGKFHRRGRRYAEALADFEHALQLSPDNAACLVGRGESYRGLGELGLALADFERVSELVPNRGWSVYRRAQIHLQREQPDQAAVLLRNALARDRLPAFDIEEEQGQALLRIVYLVALGERREAAEQTLALLASGPLVDLLWETIGELTDLAGVIGDEAVAEVRSLLRAYWSRHRS